MEAIGQGRWIADGAMWVEPDTNMAGGEALIRQLVHGKRYFKEMFGVDSRVLWLPDSFGYTAALPQILKGCDVPYMVTQKIFWSYNDSERFPYHYFYWEGMDGTKVTSFLPTSYTYQTDPEETGRVWKDRVQKEDLEAFLFPFGYGDGGGGPTRDHVEYVLRQGNLEGSPRMKMGAPEEFFRRMEEEGGPKHTYTGELYFCAHRGTYTSQAGIKKNNRKSELLLREMEFLGSLAAVSGFGYTFDRADKLWKILLFHQFHDILPGSSIKRVYEEAFAAHEALGQEALQIMKEEAQSLLKEDGGISFFNSLSFEREALVTLPAEYESGAVTMEGCRVPVQKDAWDIDSNYRSEEPEPACAKEISILGQGLWAVLQVKGTIGKSEYVQKICLKADCGRLEFDTQIEWRELHRLLKTSFPVAVHAANARHEMQFGYVERPTHRSRRYDMDRFEVCNHRYTALCDEAHGAAILNDCKYGISVNKNDMELTLLRAPASPEMQADNGLQQFAYALYAWEGSFIDSDVVRQGYEFNIAPYRAQGGTAKFEAVRIDKKNIIMETMKPAEDKSGDIILRLYEAAGAAVQATVQIGFPEGEIHICDMLEQEQEELGESEPGTCWYKLSFRAFEIKTLRYHKKDIA